MVVGDVHPIAQVEAVGGEALHTGIEVQRGSLRTASVEIILTFISRVG